MSTEARFLLAIVLMLAVLVGTNVLFPPVPPPTERAAPGEQVEPAPAADPAGGEAGEAAPPDPGGPPRPTAEEALPPEVSPDTPPPPPAATPERRVVVESPLYRFEFSNRGARLVAAEILGHRSLRTGGPLQLLRESSPGVFGQRLVVRGDTLDLSGSAFEISPAGGIVLREGDSPEELTFTLGTPESAFGLEVVYTFYPDRYVVEARGSVRGVDRGLLITGMGTPLAFTEADSVPESRMMGWVRNHLRDGIRSRPIARTDEDLVEPGPFFWAAFKSKFFVLGLFASAGGGEDDYFGAIFVDGASPPVSLSVAQNIEADGSFDYSAYVGPQDYDRLQAVDHDFSDVNPYGWRWLRPVLRPIVAVIIAVLSFLHNTLHIGYGWVLILFGVMMRVVLWPLNQKAMRAQLRNMAVQPLVKEIQAKYKDQPEKLQKEMMRLYKEHGFNPLGGCLPMLLPWPVLIALFFVFQNSIEFRGVEFLWLADLSAKDPYYILPVLLTISMFGLQYISYRSMDQENPQMKTMMYVMPPVMGFVFMQFASGLNLYYATANLATLPQQFWIAKERKKMREEGPIGASED